MDEENKIVTDEIKNLEWQVAYHEKQLVKYRALLDYLKNTLKEKT